MENSFQYTPRSLWLCHSVSITPLAVFQAFINDMLRDILGRFMFVYLAGILIFSPDLETHQHHVRQVLQCLFENKLFVKAEKCDFHATTVSFFGISHHPWAGTDGSCKDHSCNRVASTHHPESTAVCYWCFIRNYSHLAAPLTTLTFTSSPFHLSPEAESASQELKCFFTSVPVLTLVDPDFQFVVEVDSSDTRVGANNLATISCRPKASHMCFLFSQAIPSRKELQYGQPGTSSS